jgi:hypothetical protein
MRKQKRKREKGTGYQRQSERKRDYLTTKRLGIKISSVIVYDLTKAMKSND